MPFDKNEDLGDDGERLFNYSRVCQGAIVGALDLILPAPDREVAFLWI